MKWPIESRKLRAAIVATCLSATAAWSGAVLGQTAAPQPWKIFGKLIGKPKNLDGSESKNSKGTYIRV